MAAQCVRAEHAAVGHAVMLQAINYVRAAVGAGDGSQRWRHNVCALSMPL
jgi:hypothetical protein